MKSSLLIALVLATLVPFTLAAQTTPFVTGLDTPTKVIFTHAGNLAIAEAGTPADNTGRVSLVDRTSGARRSLISGLPSGIDPEGAPSGPSGLAILGTSLFVTIGSGNGVVDGPIPGTEAGNPSPSSPILSSLLELRSSRSLDTTIGGFSLTPADHQALKNGGIVTLNNVVGERLEVRLVADFPNFTDAPRSDFLQNVRASNPFGVVVQGSSAYVVDASQDMIRRVNLATGEFVTVTTFGRIANPTQVGPPTIDPVPDSIRLRDNRLYVTLLTGFPFPAGASQVRVVSTDGTFNSQMLGGLTTAIDTYPLGDTLSAPALVLEFSTNFLAGAPGRLLLARANNNTTTLVNDLVSPTSMAVDERNGDVFIVHIFPGMLSRVNLAGRIPAAAPTAIIPVVASVSGALGSRFSTSLQISNPFPYPISGRIVIHPAGTEGSETDPSLTYTLAPFETKYYAELLQSAGTQGAGSADVIAAVGGAPVALVRIAELGSPTNPEVQVPVLAPSQALSAGQTGALLTPPTERYRFNIGIRTLREGATITFSLHDASGTRVRDVTKTFGPNYFQQFAASDLLGGFINTNETVVVTMTAGSAIVYGTTIENNTSAMTLQIASAASE